MTTAPPFGPPFAMPPAPAVTVALALDSVWTETLRWVYALSTRWPSAVSDLPMLVIASSFLVATWRLWRAAGGRAYGASVRDEERA